MRILHGGSRSTEHVVHQIFYISKTADEPSIFEHAIEGSPVFALP